MFSRALRIVSNAALSAFVIYLIGWYSWKIGGYLLRDLFFAVDDAFMVTEMAKDFVTLVEGVKVLKPRPPPTRTEDIIDRVLDIGDSFLKNPQIQFWLIWGCSITFGVVLSRRILSGTTRRLVWRFRGIQYESMRPGSQFFPKEIPRFQVEIHEAGLLCGTFSGYGVRVNNFLVVPTHVVRGLTEILLVGPKGKLYLTSSPLKSRQHSDVSYYQISMEQWTRIGVSKAPGAKPISALQHVNCCGKEGASSGFLRKSSTKGVLTYTGSTVPGMSGAAYHDGLNWFGMHTGAALEENVGVYAGLIMAEIECMYVDVTEMESRKGGLAGSGKFSEEVAKRVVKATGWNDASLKEDALRAWSAEEPGWAAEEEFNWNADLNFESSHSAEKLATITEILKELSNLSPDVSALLGQELMKKAGAEVTATLKPVVAQNNAEDTVLLMDDHIASKFSSYDKQLSQLGAEISRIKGRLNNLEGSKVPVKEEPAKVEPMNPASLNVVDKVQCGACSKVLTRIGFKVHKAMKHEGEEIEMKEIVRAPIVKSQPVKPESKQSSKEGKFGCPQCKKSYVSRRAAAFHMVYAHKLRFKDAKVVFRPESAISSDSESECEVSKPFLVKNSERKNGKSSPSTSQLKELEKPSGSKLNLRLKTPAIQKQ